MTLFDVGVRLLWRDSEGWHTTWEALLVVALFTMVLFWCIEDIVKANRDPQYDVKLLEGRSGDDLVP